MPVVHNYRPKTKSPKSSDLRLLTLMVVDTLHDRAYFRPHFGSRTTEPLTNKAVTLQDRGFVITIYYDLVTFTILIIRIK
jgi:hypothetical protein